MDDMELSKYIKSESMELNRSAIHFADYNPRKLSDESRKTLKRGIKKFGLVGGIAFLIDYGLLFICTEWFGIYYFISSIISFSVSVIFNYIASVLWVFDVDQEKSKTKNFIIFITLSIVGLGINQIIMYYGVEVLNLYYMLIKLIATFIVMVFNFITRKMFLE